MKRRTLLFLAGLTVVLTGCVSQSRYDTDVQGLRGHTAVLTEQITQLDSALRQAGAELNAERARSSELRGELESQRKKIETLEQEKAGPQLYRTPGGFELPAKDIQTALKNAGYYKGAVDEKLGPDSREAIRDFQRDNGLTVDGICGRETWEKLKPYLDVVK